MMRENEIFIKLIKNIENDENFDDLQRRSIRTAIRCVAKFILFETLNGNSIIKTVEEIEKMFPEKKEMIE